MSVLPAIPMLLLAAVAVWFIWPLIADPIARAARPARRSLQREADRTADHLFATWGERN
mgnify:CR=1 FL=1